MQKLVWNDMLILFDDTIISVGLGRLWAYATNMCVVMGCATC